MKSILSHRGFSVCKESTDPKQLRKYRADLTVTPFVEREEYAGYVEDIHVFQETNKRLYMPRFYAAKHIGKPEKDKLSTKSFEQLPHMKFDGTLWKSQLEPADHGLKALRQTGGGVISIGCGGGKTSISLWLACELGIKTGVVCHDTAMMKQWVERIEQFVPKARIGIVQQDRVELEDKDIVIFSLKTVAKRKYAKDAFADIGLVIWDEIHLMCTQLFSQAFPKLATKHTLGLSATPYRKDKCHQIFQWYIGPVVYMRKRAPDDTIEVQCQTLLLEDIEVSYNKWGKINYTSTAVQCVNRPDRTEFIARQAAELASQGRTILVLGEYVKHLKSLKKAIVAQRPVKPLDAASRKRIHGVFWGKLPPEMLHMICNKTQEPVSVGLYIGEMKHDQRAASAKMDIILGTYKLASVGMDIPSLNTLILASPRKEIEQSVGRILRKRNEEFPPLIIDIIDNHSLFKSMSRVRKKFYELYGYTIIHLQIYPDGEIKSRRKMKPKKKKKATKPKKGKKPRKIESEESEEGCLF